ncbi:helix-turn-helix domain-containing protein [Thermomonospora umbrina]|uniref:Helix-turn-helix protein n=1 Tax=Thermomonospora umbrina TaxID=111806 RepID=A0A3D9SK88_9ACTN|nr:helix-turn-helix transcriptional regulator [Thermomonospora umbrina]REE96342.1 helix-turn-helix protein [Thermomonospora umbrina]
MPQNEHSDFTRDPLIRAFATLMRALREERGLSRTHLAEVLGFGPKWIEKVERCESPPSEETADALDTFFKTTGRAFWVMWREIKREGKHVALPPGFGGFVQREAEASELWIFEALAITGLFQTEEYAQEMFRAGRRAGDIEQLVASRLERQAILRADAPPEVVAVFDEGAIRRPIGGPDVMKSQVAHLIGLAQEPNITLQIVPSTKGAYAGLTGNFTVLKFIDAPDMAYVEGYAEGHLMEHPSTVRTHTLRFSLIRGAAFSADESLDLLQRILEGQ